MTGTKRKTPYALEDRIKFGQYRDRLIKDIIKKDCKYIDWLWAVHECSFTKEVWDYAREQKKETEKRKGEVR